VRKLAWCAALVLGLALASPGWAQKTVRSFGAVNPSDITFKQVDMGGAVAPVAPPSQKPFGLNNFFPRFSIPGIPNRVAVSPLPPPAAFPSTHYRNYVSPLAKPASK
jgi:hypothetical protein